MGSLCPGQQENGRHRLRNQELVKAFQKGPSREKAKLW